MVGTLLSVSSAQAAPASFEYSPTNPLTGEPVTFTSTTPGDVDESWDLDNDGFCDDAAGPSIQRSFPTPGKYGVWLCVNNESKQLQTVVVANRSPLASFVTSPARPVAGQLVTFTSTSFDFDGPLAGLDWALDRDGAYGDGATGTVQRAFPGPGDYPVSLRVVDRDGAATTEARSIRIYRRPVVSMSPFPIVRLAGRVGASGMRISAFVIRAPRNARVAVRCRGRACPYRRAVARTSARVRLRRLQRFLPAGTVIEVSVTKRGKIGKFTRFRIRRGRPPTRLDRCLKPGVKRSVSCPA